MFLMLLCLHAPVAGLKFSVPQVIGAGGGASGFIGLDTGAGVLVVGAATPWAAGSAAVSIASLNGTSPWVPQPGANKTWPGTWPFPSECHSCSTVETLGVLDPMQQQTTGVLTSSTGYTLSVDQAGQLVATPSKVVHRFQGLSPVWRGGHFTTPAGGMRWSGTASVRRPNGTLLQTGIVTFAGQPILPEDRGQNATSVVLFRSDDGVTWEYVATIADAKDYPESWEGPNEMDLATLDDGSLIAVMRMDGGDGDGGKWANTNNHAKDLESDFDHFLPYHISRSKDGTVWSKLEPLPAGCARPRLLNVKGANTLLMSGGRFHAANPKTSDVILWASKDSGRTWEEYSLSYEHNRQVNATLQVGLAINATHWPIPGISRFTSAYTSLIQIDSTRIVVVYNLHTPLGGFPVADPRSSSIFAMEVTL
jgi:hypothetical protein